MRSRVGFGAVFAVAVVMVLLYVATFGGGSKGNRKYDVSASDEMRSVTETVVTSTEGGDAPSSAAAGFAYQGLPAKFLLPSGERSSYFSQELLRTDRPHTAFVFAVSSAVVNWLGVLLAVIPLALLWRDRRGIAAAIRSRLAVARSAPLATPE